VSVALRANLDAAPANAAPANATPANAAPANATLANTAPADGKKLPAGSEPPPAEIAGEPGPVVSAAPRVTRILTPAQANKPILLAAKAPGADRQPAEPVSADKAKPAPPVETGAKADKPAEASEDRTSAILPKASPHSQAGSAATQPAAPDAPGGDLKFSPPANPAAAGIQSAPSPHATAPTSTMASPGPTPAPVPLVGVAMVVVANVHAGRNHFEIRLDPPELGRIDVRLHFDSNGHVTSHLVVDRSDTLDLLRRDAADLDRSLQQAGLKTADNGMQFSLRDQSAGNDNGGSERTPAAQAVVREAEPAAEIVMRGYIRAGQGAGVDIRV
jgi:chemotaxis protein MotD